MPNPEDDAAELARIADYGILFRLSANLIKARDSDAVVRLLCDAIANQDNAQTTLEHIASELLRLVDLNQFNAMLDDLHQELVNIRSVANDPDLTDRFNPMASDRIEHLRALALDALGP